MTTICNSDIVKLFISTIRYLLIRQISLIMSNMLELLFEKFHGGMPTRLPVPKNADARVRGAPGRPQLKYTIFYTDAQLF